MVWRHQGLLDRFGEAGVAGADPEDAACLGALSRDPVELVN